MECLFDDLFKLIIFRYYLTLFICMLEKLLEFHVVFDVLISYEMEFIP